METGGFIYSKLKVEDDEGSATSGKKVSKKKKLLKSLNNIKKVEEKVNVLKEQGKEELAAKLQVERKWKNALARCEGEKVRDDPKKIERSLKNQHKTKVRHFKKWKERKNHIEEKMERRQQRRQRNIKAKKEEKRKKKLKRLRKKGKIV